MKQQALHYQQVKKKMYSYSVAVLLSFVASTSQAITLREALAQTSSYQEPLVLPQLNDGRSTSVEDISLKKFFDKFKDPKNIQDSDENREIDALQRVLINNESSSKLAGMKTNWWTSDKSVDQLDL
jgi:hypothetical protein